MNQAKRVYTGRLPQVRLLPEQEEQLPSDAVRAGFVRGDGRPDLSRYIRYRLWPEQEKQQEPGA